MVDENQFVRSKGVGFVLPRFHLTYLLDDHSRVFTSYRKYAQMPPLMEWYSSAGFLSRTISPSYRGSIAYPPPAGFLTRPERSTHAELGIKHSAGKVKLHAVVFMRDADELLMVTRVKEQGTVFGSGYAAFMNGDYTSTKGLEVSLSLTRTAGFAAALFYSLTNAKGTASNPRSNLGKIEQSLPLEFFLAPLDYQPAHHAVVLLDYRSPKEDGFFSGFHCGVVLSYNSGHPYTRIALPTFGGMANPWNNGVQGLLDSRSAIPLEPENASSTSGTFTIDVRIGKEFTVGPVAMELYALALNLLDTKNIINVYPTTGSAQDDGWLGRAAEFGVSSNPMYAEFYHTINLNNR